MNNTKNTKYPVINLKATGKNIERLRKQRGISVTELQEYFGFSSPQAIYKWQWGESLPAIENLAILSNLFGVPMEEILVIANYRPFLYDEIGKNGYTIHTDPENIKYDEVHGEYYNKITGQILFIAPNFQE